MTYSYKPIKPHPRLAIPTPLTNTNSTSQQIPKPYLHPNSILIHSPIINPYPNPNPNPYPISPNPAKSLKSPGKLHPTQVPNSLHPIPSPAPSNPLPIQPKSNSTLFKFYGYKA